MEKRIDKKITWVIKNFSSLQSTKIYSDEFVVGGCRWRLMAYPKGNNKPSHFSLYLAVADSESLPLGWKRHTKLSFTVVNQFSDKLSTTRKEMHHWFDQKSTRRGLSDMIGLTKLCARDGFMVNGEVVVAVKVDVLEVVGQLDVSGESSPVMETIDVNGFQVLTSQVQSVKRLFERHQDVATKFWQKNPYLKTAYINVLLSLTQSLCQSPKETSKDDLAGKYAAQAYLTDAGFELGWLEKKLDEIKETKQKEEACLARLQEIEDQLKETEEQLQPLKQKYTDLESQKDKLKAELLAARAHDFSLNDDNVV
ncbi:unnamed protein product [Microthlaspi erraticum]|uniref:MATH domain-containing protein n=1 Tax=Microthlaspi erraticum TaxID=1685480 RepID=A0A6D2K877_9BRAS|nr:unnamed protein product [Microthlaspi erraticum]